jgi:hypothetical protein
LEIETDRQTDRNVDEIKKKTVKAHATGRRQINGEEIIIKERYKQKID